MNTFMELHPNIRIRLLTSFISRFVGNMVFPFMAIYFAKEFGTAMAGFLLLLNVIASLITSFFGGYISDRLGRKHVMILAQVIQIAAFTIMAAFNSPWILSPGITFAMMLLQSISSGLMNPAAEAMLIDVSTKKNRQFMYSVNYWSVNLSIAAGTIIGGLYFNSHRFMLFVILALTSVFVFTLLAFFMHESHHQSTMQNQVTTVVQLLRDMGKSYKTVTSDQRFLVFCLAHLLILSLEFQMNNYIAIRLSQEFHTLILNQSVNGLKLLSWLRVENTLLIVVFTVAVNQWMKHYRPNHVLFVGLVLYSSGYITLAFSNQWLLLAFMILVSSLGELMYVPNCQTMLASMAQENVRGAYMAVYGLVFQGAKIMGSLGVIIGAFLPSYGMAILYILFSCTGIYCFYQSIHMKRGRNRQTVQNVTL
ncbi:MDR family MFS transporter [Sporolactobacillus nakayamae]|uniref:MFS transporter, DHA1 family, multidrug resistance protein B n=1 Tax=Sporolactobacillus nakayamae TaxID=269670 RepID=A0A1I2VFX8_9BACL|nr:MFS transporter [Sporolactobacillus nakayamae]SFG88188.1 MFS transporter, DHA1 family, multidrug resistance protein B [Sporolactobacillus nakayamae]